MAEDKRVLYRRYRPRSFDEVVGQRHVVEAVKNAVATGRTAHAYLFSGPRGTGKTTVARLIAKALNCEGQEKPCNRCGYCEEFNEGKSLNLIEIDAASNRGIDEIRELREGVRFIPSQGKFKTYVIDECHQLTKDASNALLKTLEEPPEHAVFILATTEIDKVLPTIVSRAEHHHFRKISSKDISERLQKIAFKEGAKLEPDAALLISFAAEGSMRDAESILGQIMAVKDKEITRAEVENILGLPRREAARKLFEFLARKDAASALALVQEINEAGYDLNYFAKLLAQYFRYGYFLKINPALKKFVEEEFLPEEYQTLTTHLSAFEASEFARGTAVILKNLQEFRRTPIPSLPLELTVVELISNKSNGGN